MPRAIYQKEIYKREKQLDRAVYKNHKRNVIPVDSGKYIVKSISLVAGGKDYAANDELSIEGAEGDTAAVITVKTVEATKYQLASATAAGTMTGYESGETITVLGAEGDTAAVLTITAEAGSITSLTVTNAGVYAEDLTGEVSTYSYEGVGTGLELSVVAEETANSGAVKTFEYTEGLYASNLSGTKTLASVTGSGAQFNVVMESQIIGDDEDIEG